MKRFLSVITSLTLLTGCGGGPSQTLFSPALPTSAPAPQDLQQVAFSIVVPSPTSKAKYVSPATASASLAVNSGTPTVVNCTAVCNGIVQAPVGTDRFLVNLYDAAGGTGHVLSTGSATQAIVAGQANSVSLTFNGVPASIAITGIPSGTAGTAFAIARTFSVAAKDASGNTIVGTYANPIALATSDATGATSLTNATLSSSSDVASLNYTGLAIAQATISASAIGVTTATATFTPALQPIVVTTGDALNPHFAGIDFYSNAGAGSSGSFSVSEIGWTNAPYSRLLTVTPGSGCANVGSYIQAGASFTANVAAAPAAGTCTALRLSDGVGQSQAITFAYSKFGYVGSPQTLSVPAGVTQATFAVAGAAGGAGPNAALPGNGGSMTATLAVVPGTALDVEVGGAGGIATFIPLVSGAGAYNGGAPGSVDGGGGGGASDVRAGGTTLPFPLSDRIVVAGGGGGSADDPNASGGPGGNASVGGAAGNGGNGSVAAGGLGGSASSGGAGGLGAIMGALGLGGMGSTRSTGGAGGGGGFYGGGGGGGSSGGWGDVGGGGGGGGSSYPISGAGISATQGTNAGNGYVIIQF